MKLRNNLVRTVAAMSLLAASLLMVPAAQAASSTASAPSTTDPADEEQCLPISFSTASLVRDTSSGQGRLILNVTGYAPSIGETVKLEPYTYIRRPEYWGIRVIGCTSGFGGTMLTPYEVTLDVTTVLGSQGVEVIGTNASQKLLTSSATDGSITLDPIKVTPTTLPPGSFDSGTSG